MGCTTTTTTTTHQHPCPSQDLTLITHTQQPSSNQTPLPSKQVVQMLTRSSDTAKMTASARSDPPKNPIPPIRNGPNKKVSKLYERRNNLKNFKISPLILGLINELSGSPQKPTTPKILSSSILDFPSLALNPVTPLIPDHFNRSPNLNVEAEEKAIAEKGFYLHPSPANTPRNSEPPLFPITYPRVSGSSNSS